LLKKDIDNAEKKEKVYHIIRQKKKEDEPIPVPPKEEELELNAVISDM